MKDSGLCHHIDRPRGQLVLARVHLLVVVPAVQHGRAEDRGQVVERHFVLVLKLTHPHHVLDQEDDASLVRVLDDLREEAEKGRLPGLLVVRRHRRVSLEQTVVDCRREQRLWQISQVQLEYSGDGMNVALFEELLGLIRVRLVGLLQFGDVGG